MTAMRLLAIGRVRQGAEQELFARYAKRLHPALALTELPDAQGAPAEIKRREAQALLEALPAGGFLVALDEGGEQMASGAFASAVRDWLDRARPLCFAIGGAEGLDRAVIDRADRTLSLGPMTWPHRLVRVLLAEQLYRAQSIATGHPYHRAGRP